MYVLDTNACIRVLTRRSPEVVERLREHAPSEIRLCTVVLAELHYGARRSARVEENLDLIRRFAEPFDVLSFDRRSAEHYGMIRADLEAAGTTIGPDDLMIAAIARANDATLVTHDMREFTRVVGLRVEDWQAA